MFTGPGRSLRRVVFRPTGGVDANGEFVLALDLTER